MSDRTLVKTSTKGIYKRGGRYVVVYRDPQGRQTKEAAVTLAQARARQKMLGADIVRGEYRATSRVTFAEYAPGWLASYTGRTSRGVGERTLELYRIDLGLDTDGKETGKGAIAFFGRTLLTELGARELTDYAAHLSRRGLSRSSVRRAIAPVKALLATAHERDKLIRYNPAAGVRIVAPANPDEESVEKIKALKPAELRALLDAIPAETRPFFDFLAETGLRIGEAIEVRWSDIDRGTGTLTVARQFNRGKVTLPKGRKVRRIKVSSRTDAALWELRKSTRAGDGDLVFTAARGGRIDAKNLAARVLKPACVSAGLGELVKGTPTSWVTWHSFRHTCLTQLFRTGWNAKQVAGYAGHADAGFTLRVYVHLLDDDLPVPGVLDSLEGGNTGATQATETDRNDTPVRAVKLAV